MATSQAAVNVLLVWPVVSQFLAWVVVEELEVGAGPITVTTLASVFLLALVIGSRDRRWEVVIPASIYLPSAMAWFNAYAFMDSYSPHGWAARWAAGAGFPQAGFALYLAALLVLAAAGWVVGRGMKLR